MTVRILALLFTLAVSTIVRAGEAVDELVRLNHELSVATWTGDELWFSDNLADDYFFINPNGVARTKRDVIGELVTPGLTMEPFEPTEVLARVYGDTAVVTGRVVHRFTLGGAKHVVDLRYTDTYVKRKGRWLLVSGHASIVSPRR